MAAAMGRQARERVKANFTHARRVGEIRDLVEGKA
jgi:hypothetical protein